MILIESSFIDTTVSIVDETPQNLIIIESNFIGGGGGGGTWGSITGTLSDQVDLQSALDAKVPYSGATGNVTLGEYGLTTGYSQFDITPTQAGGIGRLIWNDTDGTLDLGLKGGNVTLQIGQEEVVRVVNKTGSSLNESAYQVVRVSSAQGQRLGVSLAQGNNDANSADTLGIVTETIANNQEGFITVSGLVRNINTTGSLQGETWADGDLLFLSPTTPGAITNVRPVAPNHTVILGYVVYAHGTQGKIYVKVDNGYELGELHDVYVPSPTNNDGIFWNSTNLRYENKSVITVLGYTPVSTTRTLTINGTTYDLSANRSWTIDSLPSQTGNSGKYLTTNGTIASWATIDLSAYVPTSRTISTTSPLSGGGDLSANRTLSISQATTSTDGYLSSTDWNTFNNKQSALTNPVTGTGLSGQIAYWSGTTTQTGSATLTYSPTAQLLVNNSVTAASAIARGINFTPTLIAAANSDVLVATDITPTFTNGAFTGVTNLALRATGRVTFQGSVTGTGNLSNYTVTASGALAASKRITSTLVAAANNDVLVGLDIAPTFTNGAFTGLTNLGLRVASGIGLIRSGQTATITNYFGTNSDGFNIFIGGGGNSSVGAVGSTFQGSYNVAVGDSALLNNTTGYNNVALGVNSLRANTTGVNNTAIGLQALFSNTSGLDNQSIGLQSMFSNTTGNENIGIGREALRTNTTGFQNTGIGFKSLFTNSTGNTNTAIGAFALYTNNATANTAVGFQALYSNTSGTGSTALGLGCLYSNTSGTENTAFGQDSMRFNTTGAYNTAVGLACLYTNTTGSYNIAIGHQAGRYAGSGVAVNQTSNNSIYIGFASRASANGNTNETVIGNSQLVGNGSNTTTIGNSSVTATFIQGNTQITGASSSTGNALTVRNSTPTTLFSVQNASTLTLGDAVNLILGTTTGTKIGTATSQKIGFWNATPIVQPTTAVAAATFVSNTSLIANDTATFDGYTIGQVVRALRNTGILA